MHPTEMVATDGRRPWPVHDRARRSDLEQWREKAARQARVIEKLSEELAMFRRAVVALNAQRARGRRDGRGPRGSLVARASLRGHALLEEHLPLDADAPAAARASVRGTLRDRVSADVLEVAELVISELVSNSVRHSAAPSGDGIVVVRVVLAGTMCRLEVEDPGTAGAVAPRPRDLEGGGGIGLHVVQSVSERWGVERIARRGTRVWAQLSVAAVAPAGSSGPSPERRVTGRRDEQADVRDRAAEARDRTAEQRDARLAARGDRRLRVALEDVAEDRRHAAADRRHAAADRAQARRDRVHADHDQLTGALARGAGVRAVEHEIARANRTGEPLTLAFVDVDGLKRVNDAEGHAAGDTLLRNVVEALRSGLRESDLIVRYGGDEFVCALAGATRKNAAERLAVSEGVLADFASGSLSVGLAELRAGDDLAALISRADRALYAARGQLLELR